MNFDLSPIISGVVGGLIALAIGALVKKTKVNGDTTGAMVFRYHRLVVWFAYLCVALFALVGFFGIRDWSSSTLLDRFFLVLLVLVLLGASAYMFFLGTVRITYSNLGIEYQDSLGRKSVPWEKITTLSYSGISQTFSIRTPEVSISLNNYLVGYVELLEECSTRSGVALPKQASAQGD